MTAAVLNVVAVAQAAAVAAPERVRAVAIDRAPVVDGRLDDEVWLQVPAFGNLVQDEPDEGAAPSERTEVRVAFDDRALYVAVHLFDRQPEAVLSRLARRDRDVSSDAFVLYLDPRRDRLTGVYFGLNAGGTQYDGTLSNDDWRDDTWDGVWQGEVARDQQGWTAEMRIPLSQLRFAAASGQPWGINVERIIERRREILLLVPTPRSSSGFVSRFADLEGLEALAPPSRLEVAPYLSLRGDYQDRATGDPFADVRPSPARVGLDLKLGLGGTLTLDATVYPDFGQVEVDPAVINLSDVETFYPEKRTFFIEGAGIIDEFGRGGSRSNWSFDYDFPRVFYSRRIGRTPQGEIPDEAEYEQVPDAADILGAAKLTGKRGELSIATLHALTAREVASVSTGGLISRLPVEPLTYYGVARLQRSLSGGRHGLGLLSTVVARRLDDPAFVDQFNSSALTFGLDGWTLLGANKTWALTAWSSGSRVAGSAARIEDVQESRVRYLQRPDADHLGVNPARTSLSGYAGRLTLNKQQGQVICNAAAAFTTPGFEANDIGFLGVADIVNAHVGAGYSWPHPGRVFRWVTLIAAVYSTWDFGGNNTGRGLWGQAEQQFLNYWRVEINAGVSPETMNARRTRGGPLMLNPRGVNLGGEVQSDDRRTLSGGFEASFDRSARGANDSYYLSGFLKLRPADRLSVALEPAFSRRRTVAQYLDTEEDATATATFGQRYLFGDLDQRTVSASLRASLVFTPRLSFELFVQPLISSIHYRAVRALAAPRTFDLVDTAVDPATESEGVASLRGSAVLRWEYRPGSTFYLVWNGNQGRDDLDSRFRITRGVRTLSGLAPAHVFLAKLTFWWGG
jgi:hypothetical protein